MNDMLKEIKWMRVKEYAYHHTMILIYKMYHHLTPDYLSRKIEYNEDHHQYNTRSRHNIYVGVKNEKSTEKSIYYAGMLDFNSLDSNLKECSSAEIFKRKLRKYLLAK
ncbi:hypothetical protein JTB14_038045 [Gonioctena quinquepunctata]|nr:hypothetical protein JTB14_038045 [Gonioctena quinquepunctata]